MLEVAQRAREAVQRPPDGGVESGEVSRKEGRKAGSVQISAAVPPNS